MPVVGLSAYNTYDQLTALVRSLLNDTQIAAGDVYTDAKLLNFANAAYFKVRDALENAGSPTFVEDAVDLTVAAVASVDSSVQVDITDVTADPNQLPSDLLEPVKLWERASGSSDDFVEMTDVTNNGGLPSEGQSTTLRFWEWRADGLHFIGATQDVEVRLRYKKRLSELVDENSPILIRNALRVIAYFTAGDASASLGSVNAKYWTDRGEDGLDDLLTSAVLSQQTFGRRRQPYSSRQAAR